MGRFSGILALLGGLFAALTSAMPSLAADTAKDDNAGHDDVIKIELKFVPDLRHGRAVYEICASCHLPEGWGNHDGTYPQLAGQHRSVLMRQLLDIRTGKRENPVMFPFVQERAIGGLQSLADVVAYISRLPMDPDHGRGPWWDSSPEYQSGKQLYDKHCRSCHGSQARGNEATAIPRLQGQHYAYLLRQIGLIRGGERKVNPDMQRAIAALSPAQLKLIINYLSWLPVPKAELAPSGSWRNPDFVEE